MLAGKGSWPAVPIVMPGEAFGSWFGRVAARYGLSVSDLARAADVKIDLGDDGAGWLVASPPVGLGAVRLSSKTGISAEIFGLTPRKGSRLLKYEYCHHCLVVNPRDVTAPFWHERWLASSNWTCREHPSDRASISRAQVGNCRNMSKLMALIWRDRCWKRAAR